MQSFVVFAAILAVASSAAVQQYVVPQFGLNSAVVTNQRVGGNFAYTIQQQPGYNAYTTGYNGVVSPYVASPYVASPYVASQYVAGSVVAPKTVVPQTYTTGSVVPTTYTVQGNKLVAGVNPVAYTTGYNTLGYNTLGYNNLAYNQVAGYPYYNTAFNGAYGNVVVA